jgi:hypothetical protein
MRAGMTKGGKRDQLPQSLRAGMTKGESAANDRSIFRENYESGHGRRLYEVTAFSRLTPMGVRGDSWRGTEARFH